MDPEVRQHSSPEFELVVRCARTRLHPSDHARIGELLEGDVDWDYLLRLANYHGVRPLVHRTLADAHPEALPPDVRAGLDRQAHATSALNRFLTKELGRLMRLFEANDLQALALKGPVVAQWAYGDLGLRPFIDLDILIRGEDLDRLQGLLAEEGYKPFEQVIRRKGLNRKLYLWQGRQLPMQRGGGTFNLDVHTGIMPLLYYYAPDFDTLWGRAQVVTVDGEEIPSLDAPDLLQMLCYHGEKNRWETLKYVCDVAEFVGANPELDWDEVMRRARETHGERILLLGLSLARLFLDAPLPADVSEAIRADRYVGQLTDFFADRLPRQIDLGITPLKERVRLHMLLQNTLKTKARYGFFALLRRLMDVEA